MMISYAQNFEDVMLARVLGDRPRGFYIDIGACFPDVASVTRHFYDLGWHGINVEPMPGPFERLVAERSRDTNIRAAIASFTGEIAIYEGASVGESSVLRPFDTARPTMVPCMTLAELCERHAAEPIDFLKVDVEGLERDVLASGDWQRFRPSIVVVEVTLPWSTQRRPDAADIGALLAGYGYGEVYFDGLNAFFVADEARSLAARFAAPPNVLDRFSTAREAELEAAAARFAEHAEGVSRRLGEVEARSREIEEAAAREGARAHAAEALAEERARSNATLGATLQEKEGLLQQAQRAWLEGVANVERLHATVAEALRDAAAARALADAGHAELLRGRELAAQAEALQRDASMREEQAQQRARLHEAQAAAAESRAVRAESRCLEIEAEATRAAAAAAETVDRLRRETARLAELEARLREADAGNVALDARLRHATLRALQGEHTIESMKQSRSWRITSPLRVLGDWVRGGPRGASPGTPPPPVPAHARRRAAALRRTRDLAQRTRLYGWLVPRLKQRYPHTWSRMRGVLTENPAPVPLPSSPAAMQRIPSSATGPAQDGSIEALASRIREAIAARRGS